MENNQKDMLILMEEQFQDITPAVMRNYLLQKQTEQGIADAYAIAHNKFWWVEDNRYDYEEGTSGFIKACAITEEWREVLIASEEKIFDILRGEGVTIPKTGQILVLEPFMQRNGYYNGSGWWIKKRKESKG